MGKGNMGYEALPKVSTRKDMYDQLDAAIRNIADENDDVEDSSPQRKYLKALIIESNSPLETLHREPNVLFIPTEDPNIYLVRIDRTGQITFSYLDTLDPRFWTLYSLDKSQEIKTEVNRFIQKNNSRLDYAWFSSSSLQAISSRYSKTSFTMKFLNSFNNENIPMKRLSIRLWAEDASDIMGNLLRNEYIGTAACLSNIEVLHSGIVDQYIKTRLSMEGNITVSKGNSVEELLEYQQQIVQGHYKPIIETIEKDYTICYSCKDGVNIGGDLLSIKLSKKLSNIENISNQILKGIQPFRFTGFINKISDDNYLLNVLDLHNFGRFDMEIYPDEILINLPQNSCGNSVLRLFALCQERIDPNAELRGDGSAIITA